MISWSRFQYHFIGLIYQFAGISSLLFFHLCFFLCVPVEAECRFKCQVQNISWLLFLSFECSRLEYKSQVKKSTRCYRSIYFVSPKEGEGGSWKSGQLLHINKMWVERNGKTNGFTSDVTQLELSFSPRTPKYARASFLRIKFPFRNGTWNVLAMPIGHVQSTNRLHAVMLFECWCWLDFFLV